MLWWLVTNGHSAWMWDTKAWFKILTNEKSEFPPSNQVWMRSPSGRRILSACDYVAYFMHRRNAPGTGTNPFT